jgi:sensor histidine kinase YesM
MTIPNPTPWNDLPMPIRTPLRRSGPNSTPRGIVLYILAVLTGNVLIGLLLWVVGFGGSLGVDVVYAECIGCSICGLGYTAFSLTRRGSLLRLGLILVAILAGSTLGQILGNLILRTSPHLFPNLSIQSAFIGLFFGGLGSTAMFIRERTWDLEAELQARELQRLEADKRSVEAQLKMLQAQIEPHFLFNTLANLAGLIETDPKLGSRLLEALSRYLRASLKRTRADGGTLGDELGLLEAYLDVLKIRLGPRLDYGIAVPQALRALPFPPMLLLPLVENAVKHGIEPLIPGGRIDIAAVQGDGCLRVTVRDTGTGFTAEPGNGIGLDNIRARLAALFGEAGSLELAEPVEGGVLATLRLPS